MTGYLDVMDSCKECGEPVGMVDIGDVDGLAAVVWRDYVTRRRIYKYGETVDLFHVDCEPAR